jgi:hypothetical protein
MITINRGDLSPAQIAFIEFPYSEQGQSRIECMVSLGMTQEEAEAVEEDHWAAMGRLCESFAAPMKLSIQVSECMLDVVKDLPERIFNGLMGKKPEKVESDD